MTPKDSAKYLFTIFFIIGGYLALTIFDTLNGHHYLPFCIFKLVTGIPCPGCGMGRATLELLKGNIAGSFSYNILCIPFTLAIVFSLLWLCTDLVQQKKRFFSFIKKDANSPAKGILFLLIVVDWVMNVYRHI